MTEERIKEVGDEFEPDTPEELETRAEKNIKSFTKLIEGLSNLHDKKKLLWKEIYENAVLDRRNAYIMFGNLYQKVHGSSAEHAIHGQTLAKYLERMNKSNEQLLKLAEILDDAVDADEESELDEDAFYNSMEANSAGK